MNNRKDMAGTNVRVFYWSDHNSCKYNNNINKSE